MTHTGSVRVLAVVAVLSTVLMTVYMDRAEAARYTGGYFLYNNPEDFWKELATVIKEGTEQSIDPELLEAIGKEYGLTDEIIGEYKYFTYSFSTGSLYALGCLLPHEPPLNVGESVQCGVLFLSMGSPVTINDLHVYANAPSGTIPMFDEDWAPGTIPDPFIWLSSPIPLTEAGEWHIIADFTKNSSVVLTLEVTFQVIPESILGVAGVIAAPFALLAYRLRSRRAAVQ